MRLLAPIRLSLGTDTTNSPYTQRAGIIEYADGHPGTTIIWTDTEDIDISGAMPIRERPGIKEFFTPEKFNTWDAIGGYEMDRLSRDMLDYLQFVRDMAARGKIIIDLYDGTDTTTTRGKQILEDRVLAAQRYREIVAEKRAKAAQRISDAGRWGGGRIPFGYVPVKRDDGWYLVQDGINAPIAKRMVSDAIDGKGLNTIARELNSAGILSPLGREWRDNSVRRVLISPALIGQVVQMRKNDVTVRRGRDGKPITFTDQPLITDEQWSKLQDALKIRARHRGQAQARHLLWHVAYCRNCSVPCDDELPCLTHDVTLYGHRRIKNQAKGNFYACKQCGTATRLERLEDYVTRKVLDSYGSRLYLEQVTIQGDDHSAEIIKLERRAERLRNELDAEYDADLEQAIRNIEAKLAELISGPHEPDRVVWRPVQPETTVAQHWAQLDTIGRNKFLRDYGFVFYADKKGVSGHGAWVPADTQTFPVEPS